MTSRGRRASSPVTTATRSSSPRRRAIFVWHSHPETDDLFLVLEGRLTIQLRDGDVELGPGELFVVPRGVEYRPRSEEGASILLIEPEGTPPNTGDPATAAPDVEL